MLNLFVQAHPGARAERVSRITLFPPGCAGFADPEKGRKRERKIVELDLEDLESVRSRLLAHEMRTR